MTEEQPNIVSMDALWAASRELASLRARIGKEPVGNAEIESVLAKAEIALRLGARTYEAIFDAGWNAAHQHVRQFPPVTISVERTVQVPHDDADVEEAVRLGV